MAARVTFLLVILVVLPFPSHCADPDPLQDFCVAILNSTSTSLNGFPCKPASEVTSEDFFFDGFTKEGNTDNALGFSPTFGNVLSFPGLNTLGIAMNRVDFAPGGLNPPHSHPRATESGVVIKGKLFVGFLTTNNVLYSKVLTVGQMFVVPRGLVHFQMNVGKEKAITITAFNSQLPGVATLANTLFGSNPPIPDDVLTKAFQVEASVIDGIKAKFGA
ncbi:Germin-like protein 3-7 [Capsicum annuum]|nr:Germin-like protein 3-7 [Capsicum annuum]